MRPLHHGDGGTEPSNWLQGFNDSPAGVFLAGILHSVGALFFAGGIALYLYVAHSIRRSSREGGPTNVGLLTYAHAFTLGGIVLNGVGGVMRLYESDHPGIDRLGDSTWVQVLLVKHLFLVLGVGLAVWLAWRTRHLTRAPERAEKLEAESTRMGWFAAASFSTILLAAVLGAAAGNVNLASDLGEAPPLADMGGEDHAAHGEGEVLNEHASSGTLTGTPGQPGTHDITWRVPSGTDRVTIALSWDTVEGVSAAELDFQVQDESGQAVDGERTRIAGAVTLVVSAEGVRPGLWTVTVTAQRALQQAWTLHASAVRTGGDNLIERTVTVPPDAEFFEANLLMGSGQAFSYEWAIENATNRKVHFDIHLHVGGEVRYAVDGEFSQHRGNYTHDGSSQGPSLLWQNDGSDAVQIRFRVKGDFSLHSYYPE